MEEEKKSAKWGVCVDWVGVTLEQLLYIHAVVMPQLNEVIEEHRDVLDKL